MFTPFTFMNHFCLGINNVYEKDINLEIAKKELNGNFTGIFRGMEPETVGTDMLDFLFKEAVSVAEERNVPLYCGEYGVINLANAESALAWHRDIHEVFERYGIGRALWSYKKMDFGIVDAHYEEVMKELVKVL